MKPLHRPTSPAIRMALIVIILALMSGNLTTGAQAQVDLSPSPPVENATEPTTPEESPTALPPSTVEIPTETEIPFVPPSSTPTEPVLDLDLDPTEPLPTETAATSPTQPEPTVTSTATIAATTGPADVSTGIRVLIKDGDNFGPPMAGVCMTLYDIYLGFWQDRGCTDATGTVVLNVIDRYEGTRQYSVRVDPPFGYLEPDSRAAFIPWGQIVETTIFVVPRPAGTETLIAVDGSSGARIGGACWTYFDNVNGQPGVLELGPLCDTDADGVVTVTSIPYGTYCVVPAPPPGYTIVGTGVICNPPADRNFTFTKAFVTSSSPVDGALSIHAHANWGEALADVCPRLTLTIGGATIDVGSGCTDSNGNLTLTGLAAGTYTLVNGTVPARFSAIVPESVTISASQTTSLDLVVPAASSGDTTAKAVFGYGPDTLGGACWSYETASPDLQPTGIKVIGPVCDEDGDGTTVIKDVPYGAFCVVITSPPPGFVRYGDNFVCRTDMRSGRLIVGFSQPLPTATATRTPGPTWTPSATSTQIPTPPPVGNEPNTGLVVRYCHQSQIFDELPYFTLCKPAPAGITFNIIQNGTVVGTTTTVASGVASITIDQRVAYRLVPTSGLGPEWTSGTGEEAKTRYGATQQFHFEPAPSVNRTWTMKVRVKEWDFWNGNGYTEGPPIPGACFRIIGADGNEYLPEQCDTDNDGEVIMGQLPPRLHSTQLPFYSAVMTSAPIGYYVRPEPQIGSVSIANPNEWITTYTYWRQELQVRTVDPDGNPVSGFCFTLYPLTIPPGTGLYTYRSACDYQGLARIENPQELISDDQRLSIHSSAPGYLPDVWYQDLIINPADTIRVVTFIVRPYGTNEPDQASARLRFRDNLQILRRDFKNGLICSTLSPNTGSPQGQACEGQNQSEILFKNLDPGTYTANLTSARERSCAIPPVVTFEITEADLGKEKIIEVTVACGNGVTCIVFRESPGRSVDLYLGTLYDPDGNRIDSSIVSSETLARLLIYDLLDRFNPDPARINEASLSPWIESWGDGGSSWAVDADYDGDARKRLLESWSGYGELDIDEPNLIGSYDLVSGVALEEMIANIGQTYPEFPECDNRTWVITTLRTYMATLNVYEMDAHQIAPEEPTATRYPTQEPVCDTVVTRNLTAFYGSLTDKNGNVLLDALALSDRIPVALRNAIRNAQSPGEVRNLISQWMDRDLLPEDWGFAASDGLDPQSGLIDQYQAMASEVSPGSPAAGETITYTYESYRLYDDRDLPDQCVSPPIDGASRAAELGRLIPVLQTTRVQVTYYELNAVAGGTIQPTSTPTALATTEPSVSPVATETPATAAPTETASATATASTEPVDPTETAIAAATDIPGSSPTPADDDVNVTQLPNTGAAANGPGSMPGAIETLAIILLALSGLTVALRTNRRARI